LAMAAQAGLNHQTSEWDDGVDLQIGSTKPAVSSVATRNVWFSVQLKATHDWEVRNGTIAFYVDRETHEHLRLPSVSPQYLVLYTMPNSRLQWITHHHDHSRFSHRFYYISLANEKPLGNSKHGVPRKGKTIYLPSSQIMTAGTLLRLYKDAAKLVLMGGVTAATASSSQPGATAPTASSSQPGATAPTASSSQPGTTAPTASSSQPGTTAPTASSSQPGTSPLKPTPRRSSNSAEGINE
jgi:hypothetical protein